jgi:hypothetical protein
VFGVGIVLAFAQLWTGCMGDPAVGDSAAGDDTASSEVDKAFRRWNGLPGVPGLDRGEGLATTLGLEPGDPIDAYVGGLEQGGWWSAASYLSECAQMVGVDAAASCDDECRQSASACLLALTNVRGSHEYVELVSASIASIGTERTYRAREATFFGDVLGYEAHAYVARHRSYIRACSGDACAFTEVSGSACDTGPSVCWYNGEWRYPISIFLPWRK